MITLLMRALVVSILTYLVGSYIMTNIITGTSLAQSVMTKLFIPSLIIGIIVAAVTYRGKIGGRMF